MTDDNDRIDRLVDDALRRIFEPPSDAQLEALIPAVETAGVDDKIKRPAWRPRLAIAAGIAAALTGGWLLWDVAQSRVGNGPYVLPPWRSLATVYADESAGPFEPLWVCKDNAEFAATFDDQLGQPLVLAALPEHVEAIGLSYCHSLSTRTVYLLARVEDHRVLVFVDRGDAQAPPPVSEGLNQWNRRIGDLVLYEVSPLSEPVLLDRFAEP